MNTTGQVTVFFGFVLLVVAFVLVLVAFVTIEPLKESLDSIRGTSSLNCPGTDGFNQTAYDEDDKFDKLSRRPTCFVTGLTMVYFVGAFIIAICVWVISNWRKLAK